MATDPVRRIRERVYDSELDLDVDLKRVLRTLADLPPSVNVPYLTASLDWRPEGSQPGRLPAEARQPSRRRSLPAGAGTSQRPAREQFERESAALVAALGTRGEALASVQSDVERVTAYLDHELDASAQGVFIVASAAQGVFETLALGLPLETRVVLGPTPDLMPLARMREDFPTYAVLVADQREGILTIITQGQQDEGLYVESSLYPRKQKQGGLNQRRYQARADERVAAFARVLADEVQRALEKQETENLIVAGDEIITSALTAVWHPTTAARIAATIRLDITASFQQVLEATQPIIQELERDREAQAVDGIVEGLARGAGAVGGPEDVIVALQAGQVAKLVMVDEFTLPGWSDYAFPLFGVGEPPSSHPAGGDPHNIVATRLEDELVRLALLTDSDIEIVHSAPAIDPATDPMPDTGAALPLSDAASKLHELGGVGAHLRFDVSEETIS
jgi:hypothetical protein